MTERATADLWVDPACPWAWLTSRWLLEVEKVRPVDIRWHVMSLAVLNEARRDADPDQRSVPDPRWGPVRVLVAARELHGEQYLRPLYEAMGGRVHPGGRRDVAAVIAEALAEVGLPAELAGYAGREDVDPQVRASHAEGIGKVGLDVGTPVIAVGDVAFFGPVVTPAPRAEAAGRLWDGVVLVAATPGFYELKRTRTQGPIFG